MRTRIRGLLAAAILTGGARRLLTPGVTTGDTGRIGRQTVKLSSVSSVEVRCCQHRGRQPKIISPSMFSRLGTTLGRSSGARGTILSGTSGDTKALSRLLITRLLRRGTDAT